MHDQLQDYSKLNALSLHHSKLRITLIEQVRIQAPHCSSPGKSGLPFLVLPFPVLSYSSPGLIEHVNVSGLMFMYLHVKVLSFITRNVLPTHYLPLIDKLVRFTELPVFQSNPGNNILVKQVWTLLWHTGGICPLKPNRLFVFLIRILKAFCLTV